MDFGKKRRMKRNRQRRNRMYNGRNSKRDKKSLPKWVYAVIGVVFLILIVGSILVYRHQKKMEADQNLKVELQEKAKKEKEQSDSSENTSEEEEKATVTEYEKKAKEIVSKMTLDDKVLGMIITSPEDFTGIKVAVAAGDQSKQVLNQYAIGGLTYQEKNFENISQLQLMLTNTSQYSKYPIFLCTDQACKKAASSSGKSVYEMGFNVDRSDGWIYVANENKTLTMTTTLKIEECEASNAAKTVESGADMIVLEDGFEEAYKNIMAAVKDGSIKESQLDKSMIRIMKIKVQK